MSSEEKVLTQKQQNVRHLRAVRKQRVSVINKKITESLTSVLPVTIIVLVLCFTIAPVPTSALMSFVIGAILLIVGMGLFTLGAEMSMTPLGERVGAHVTKSRKIWMIVLFSFLLGVIITISEPDLQVLAGQVPTIPNMTLILAVAVGVGIFLVIALLRIVLGIPLSYLLIGFYIIVFVLAMFVPSEFLAVAFDSGGVTTGPMTVPFIMAFGIGAASMRSDKHAANDSFGLVALSSIGPILAVLILGILYDGSGEYVPVALSEVDNSQDLWFTFMEGFPEYIVEMATALAPIVIFFVFFQIGNCKCKLNTSV